MRRCRRRGIAAVLSLALLASAAPGVAATRGRLLVLRADGVQLWFDVELALDAESRRVGLMWRTQLAPRHGMWFDFESALPVTMWMKNTPVPLDMFFVATDGTIAAIHAHAEPYSLDTIMAPRPVRYVLELAAGSAAAHELGVGDRALLVAGDTTGAQRIDGRSETLQ